MCHSIPWNVFFFCDIIPKKALRWGKSHGRHLVGTSTVAGWLYLCWWGWRGPFGFLVKAGRDDLGVPIQTCWKSPWHFFADLQPKKWKPVTVTMFLSTYWFKLNSNDKLNMRLMKWTFTKHLARSIFVQRQERWLQMPWRRPSGWIKPSFIWPGFIGCFKAWWQIHIDSHPPTC